MVDFVIIIVLYILVDSRVFFLVEGVQYPPFGCVESSVAYYLLSIKISAVRWVGWYESLYHWVWDWGRDHFGVSSSSWFSFLDLVAISVVESNARLYWVKVRFFLLARSIPRLNPRAKFSSFTVLFRLVVHFLSVRIWERPMGERQVTWSAIQLHTSVRMSAS